MRYEFGKLGYRTVEFERQTGEGDYQGCAVINYTDETVPYTRIHEHKHFSPWESLPKTLVLRKTSRETGKNDTPFYPKRLSQDLEKYQKYKRAASAYPNISFVGRLGSYRYLDMDQVIGEALDFVEDTVKNGSVPPQFAMPRHK